MHLAIKMNDSIAPSLCPLCGRETNPNIGPELTLAVNTQVVCHDCGRDQAPALVTMLELASIAEDLSLYVRDYGERWRASLNVKPRRGLDWNAFKLSDEE